MFTIAAGLGQVKKVRVSATMTHPRVGDLVAQLIAPNGVSHVLFGYTGATTATSAGSASRLNGSYLFEDGPLLADWWTVGEVDDPLPSVVYNTSAIGGPGSTGAITSIDAAFSDVSAAGVWTLRLTDGFAGSAGTISAATLALETDLKPSAAADSYSTAFATSLDVVAPGVLGNDDASLGGAMSALLVSGPSRGTVTLAASGAFTYTPAVGFAGTDSFTYRADAMNGPGTVATVSIVVAPPATTQPPTDFRAALVNGNQVTLRWTPASVGPAAADYVIEGGITPGQVLGALPVGGALPILTAGLPTGAFYLRVHAVFGGQQSGPSNEIRVFVNTPATPSAPADLTGLVNGTSLGLSWRTTFGGGVPTDLLVDITGSATATLRVPATETFTFGGVPGGTYTFRTRAANGSGTSVESNAVTLTVPTGCTGAPNPPANVLAYTVGNVVHIVWDPPATGAAPSSYALHVSGGFTGTLPIVARNLSAPAPPGAYGLSLSAVNACGSSAQTPPQTVFVQ